MSLWSKLNSNERKKQGFACTTPKCITMPFLRYSVNPSRHAKADVDGGGLAGGLRLDARLERAHRREQRGGRRRELSRRDDAAALGAESVDLGAEEGGREVSLRPAQQRGGGGARGAAKAWCLSGAGNRDGEAPGSVQRRSVFRTGQTWSRPGRA